MKFSTYFKKIPGQAIGVITVVMTILGAWWQLENNIETKTKQIVSDATVIISSDVKRRTDMIIEFQRDDLTVRIRSLQREIEQYRNRGEFPPERLQLTLDSLQDQLDEVNRKWSGQ